MQSRFDHVLIFCPEGVTGGPEALHQLAHSINKQGGNARMVYTGPFSKYKIENGVVSCELHPETPTYRTYRHYFSHFIPYTAISSRSLLVFPEYHVDLAWETRRSIRCSVACWWLGVPGAASVVSGHDEAWRRSFMSDLIHFYQSLYALEYLQRQGASTAIPLFDYTDRNFIHYGLIRFDKSRMYSREARSIAFFPRKGGEAAIAFFERLREVVPDVHPIPIESMSKLQVLQALGAAQIYVDFGAQPGKDRVPREAAAAGAIVLLCRVGAGALYQDHPVDPLYKFDVADINSGSLVTVVKDILERPLLHFSNQELYRQQVLLEREEFDMQVRRFFFTEL